MIADTELLRRYAEKGDETAFTELVQRCVPFVYAVAKRKLGDDSHLAEDVVQRVFNDMARKAPTLCRHPVLSAWLFTSTHYAANQLARAEHRRRTREEKAEAMKELPDPAADTTDFEQLRPVLDDLIRALGERDREAVLLRYFEGLSWLDIGARLRLTDDGARSRVERALEKLRGMLARRGVRSTTGALGLALAGQSQAAVPASLALAVAKSAVASVGTTGVASAAAWLSFMSTGKAIGVAVVLLAVSAAVGVHEHNQARAARQGRDEQAQARALWQGRAEEAERRLAALAASSVSTPPKPAPAPPTRVATAADAEATALAERDRQIAADPELQQLYLRQQTLRYRTQYGPFYRSASLSPEQIARVEKILADYAQATLDVRVVAATQDLPQDGPAVTTLLSRAKSERDSGLQVVLGGVPGLARWSEYERTLPFRNLAHAMATELYYTATPLTADQAEALTRVTEDSLGGRGAIDMGYVVREAARFLSPEQLRAVAERKETLDIAEQTNAKTRAWQKKHADLFGEPSAEK